MNHLKCVEQICFDDAEKFLEYLNPTNSRWKPQQRLWGEEYDSPWIFRGHKDASWILQPRAWRADGQIILAPILERLLPKIDIVWDNIKVGIGSDLSSKKDITAKNLVQVAAEYEVVIQFAKMADRLGHPVPDSENLVNSIDFLLKPTAYKWPAFEPNITFGLAQHHGIPTRLMDWTYNPFVAAFFAAEPADEMQADQIAVWALNLHRVNTKEKDGKDGWKQYRIRTLTCPHYQHSFLHAQDALFLWDYFADIHFLEHGTWPVFDEIVDESSNESGPKPLRKITLLAHEASRVLQLLWGVRISRAHLMPTYDNITAALRLKWSWQ